MSTSVLMRTSVTTEELSFIKTSGWMKQLIHFSWKHLKAEVEKTRHLGMKTFVSWRREWRILLWTYLAQQKREWGECVCTCVCWGEWGVGITSKVNRNPTQDCGRLLETCDVLYLFIHYLGPVPRGKHYNLKLHRHILKTRFGARY